MLRITRRNSKFTMERKLENLFRLMPQVCIAECNLMDEKYFILDAREEGICSRQCMKRVGSGRGRGGGKVFVR